MTKEFRPHMPKSVSVRRLAEKWRRGYYMKSRVGNSTNRIRYVIINLNLLLSDTVGFYSLYIFVSPCLCLGFSFINREPYLNTRWFWFDHRVYFIQIYNHKNVFYRFTSFEFQRQEFLVRCRCFKYNHLFSYLFFRPFLAWIYRFYHFSLFSINIFRPTPSDSRKSISDSLGKIR
jgi:hypothetical protein